MLHFRDGFFPFDAVNLPAGYGVGLNNNASGQTKADESGEYDEKDFGWVR